MVTRSTSARVGCASRQRQSESRPNVAWAASAASSSGVALPRSVKGGRRSEETGALAKWRPAAGPPPSALGVPQHRQCRGGDVPVGLGQHAAHPAPHLALGHRLLGHLVRQVALQSLTAVLQNGGDQVVLGTEVAVEGVVRQTRLGDDVGHAGPRRGPAAADDLERSVEEASDLAGVLVLPLGQCPAHNATGDIVRRGGWYCVLDSQNHILIPDRGRVAHGVGLRNRS